MAPVIEVERLHKRYGEVVAVDEVSFSVDDGEIFGIIGPNGAGKTTSVECVIGLRTPDRGRISVLGIGHRAWFCWACWWPAPWPRRRCSAGSSGLDQGSARRYRGSCSVISHR